MTANFSKRLTISGNFPILKFRLERKKKQQEIAFQNCLDGRLIGCVGVAGVSEETITRKK